MRSVVRHAPGLRSTTRPLAVAALVGVAGVHPKSLIRAMIAPMGPRTLDHLVRVER